ncbi:hypothetical protein ACLB2K_055029 [Fragaria x ananassa]
MPRIRTYGDDAVEWKRRPLDVVVIHYGLGLLCNVFGLVTGFSFGPGLKPFRIVQLVLFYWLITLLVLLSLSTLNRLQSLRAAQTLIPIPLRITFARSFHSLWFGQ